MKLCLTLILLCSKLLSYSQLNHMPQMLGRSDVEVISFLDSLNELKPNPNFKIQTYLSSEGDKVLSATFLRQDEDFFKCLLVIFRFKRIKGLELCDRQGIVGTEKFAEANLNYIKDNYKTLGNSQWEKVISSAVKIHVQFNKGESETYDLNYTLR